MHIIITNVTMINSQENVERDKETKRGKGNK